MAAVYLLHFSPALSQAKHYCGYTPNKVSRRVSMHRRGRGAKICAAAIAQGSILHVAKTWLLDTAHDARVLERTLKNTHNLKQYCPLCRRGRTKQLRMEGL